METIQVKTMTVLCLAERDGMLLREKIQDALKSNQKICVDFEGITTFATPFFNVSLGYFIGKLGIQTFGDQIEVINLSSFGESVYQRVYENAMTYYESSFKTQIDEIITDLN